jgi:hypothetical protein
MAEVALELQQQPVALDKRELASDVLAAQARAHVQARYIVANTPANKRDWDNVRQRILKDCERPTFAETAIYKKPMGGATTVTGLSIRFAESAQRAMGNLMPERTIVYDDPQKRIIRIAMTDLESNVTHYKDLILEKTVERKNPKGRTVLTQRLNSYGEAVYIVEATEDELLTKESSISSKIERQLTLKILPGDIQDEALRTIRATQQKADKADPDGAKKRLIDSFDDLGIRVPDLKSFLGIETMDNLQPSDLKQLREVYAAIKEGETNWREVMEQREAARGKKAEENGKSQGLADRIRQKSASAKTEPIKAEPMSPELTKVNEAFKALSVPPMEQAQMLKDYKDRLPELLIHLTKVADGVA